MHAQADTQRKTHTQARISIYWIAKCLHCKVRGSHVFAGAQGLVTLCRYIHMAALFAPCDWAVACMCVCAQWGLYVCVCVCVCASVWIGVCLSAIKPDRSLSRVPHHSSRVSHCAVFHFNLFYLSVFICFFLMLCFLMPSCLFLMYFKVTLRPTYGPLLHVIPSPPVIFPAILSSKGQKAPQ